MKDGGGVRDYTYTDDDEISVDFLKADAKKLFFPEGMSKLGAAGEMHFDLGNFAQERITEFTDVDGNTCTFQEYLRSRGLFASRCFVYLMSTTTEEDKEKASSCPSRQEGSDLLKLPIQVDAAAQNTTSDVFIRENGQTK